MRLIFVLLLLVQFVSGAAIAASALMESPASLVNFGIGFTMVTTSFFMFGGLFKW